MNISKKIILIFLGLTMKEKKTTERITISLERELLDAFDHYMDVKGYTNRSEGMRDAVRHLLAHERIRMDENAPCVGCVTYLYDHQQRQLSSRLMEAQHHHHEVPAATLHLHVNTRDCLEATVLRGRVKDVRDMADQITSQTGVRHGQLHIIPVDTDC
jgi:CopG family nickel-responsive transcriptional regulator